MQPIQNVAILGAGAMGAYFASRFFDSDGFSTFLIARGERLKRLNNQGLVINEKHYPIPAVCPEDADFTADLIIVALKHHHLEDAINGLDRMVGPETVFLSVMNGLESEETIGKVYGMDKVLYTISIGIDAVREGNRIVYTSPGTHQFGEAQNKTISPRVQRVQEAFERAGIKYKTPEDMLRMLWWKCMVNVGVNQASAVMRAPYGIFHTNPDAQGLMEALMQEVVTLAQAENINLTTEDIREWYTFLHMLSPDGKTSMLQDIEAGRKTEVELFGGKMVELGVKHGIPTPVNETIYRIIRVIEENF